jgi:hypothetical protein
MKIVSKRIVVWVTFFTALAGLGKFALANPDDPTLGGCVDQNPDNTCKVSAHPTVLAPLGAVNLKEGKILYGMQAVALGACYGVTYQPGKWYASGASFCLNVAGGSSAPTQLFPSGVLQLVNWGAVGMGSLCTERTGGGGLNCQAFLLFGVNVPIQ